MNFRQTEIELALSGIDSLQELEPTGNGRWRRRTLVGATYTYPMALGTSMKSLWAKERCFFFTLDIYGIIESIFQPVWSLKS